MSEVDPSLEDELASFRSEWKQEVASRQRAQHVPPATTSSAGSPPAPPTATLSQSPRRVRFLGIEDQVEALTIQNHEDDRPEVVAATQTTPVEKYEQAVRSEREGRLNDALKFYRMAFREDPNVDRAWHQANVLQLQRATSISPPRHRDPATIHHPTPTDPAFSFERTVQVAPDYAPERERRSTQVVKSHGLSGRDEEDEHPSSTRFLLTSLLKSFEANPWVPISLRVEEVDGQSTEKKVEKTPFVLKFHSEDETLPVYFNKLPPEVLLLILRHLVFSSVIPPPRQELIPTEPTSEVAAKGKRKNQTKLTVKAERELLEMEMGLESAQDGWKSDVEALERFGKTCRAARVLTLDESIWKDLCFRTYVPPHQISKEESAAEIIDEQHAGDFRRCFIEHPRIRLDGAYIAVVTYHRRGDAGQAWYSPTHIVTFYRYLRFYPSGLVLSYLTVDPPGTIVKQLNPALKAKGLTQGRWRLRGDMVDCWSLKDSSVKESDIKYTFRMSCKLKSTARGRMNKLEMISLATEKKATGELEDLPIRPTKPFFFSKVNAFATLDE